MIPEVQRCLKLINTLLETKNKRLDDLLACKTQPSVLQNPAKWPVWCNGWAFNVGPHFANALDIRLTQRMVNKRPIQCWTQGCGFAFQTGNAIHTYPKELDDAAWSEQLRHNPFSVQVLDASPAIPIDESGARNPGKVRFQILTRNSDSKLLMPDTIHETTQDDFVRYLVTGELP